MERSVRNKIQAFLVLSLVCVLLLNAVDPMVAHAAATYKISYNANGGSGAPAAQTKKSGVNIQLSTKRPVRTGHTFMGWSSNSKAITAAYFAGGMYKANASITLYAVWKKNIYLVTYNANGGSGAPAAQIKTYGTVLTLSSKKPVRNGYTFMGWSSNSKATKATYSAGGIYRANASATLYAVWAKNIYKISYSANGGSGAPAAQTKAPGVNIQLSSKKPIRTGHSFQGWSYNSKATVVSYAAGSIFKANISVTLYAVWKKNTYKITYNANGGSGAPAAQTKTYGTSITLSSAKPTRSKHIFEGWATSSSAKTAMYKPGGKYAANSAATLYAVWAKSSYKITYNANGGSAVPAAQTKFHRKPLTLSKQICFRTDYIFVGWSTDPKATAGTYQPGDVYTANAAATLYAVWKVNKTLHVPLYQQLESTTCGSASGIMMLKYYGIEISEEKFRELAKDMSGIHNNYTLVHAVTGAINFYLADAGISITYKDEDTSLYSEDQYQDLIIKNITKGYPVQPVMTIPAGDGYFPYDTTGHYVVIKGVRHILDRGYFAVCNDPHKDYCGVYNVPISKIKEYNKVHSGFVICVKQ